jgi:CheY-like chemotaxis protein
MAQSPGPPHCPRMCEVLVVDDDVAIRRVLRRILEGGGHSVREATDGTEAIRLLGEIEPEVLMTDLNMPGMNGLELLRRLSLEGHGPGPAVIALSGSGTDGGQLDMATRLGACVVLGKPFERREILAAVETARATRAA